MARRASPTPLQPPVAEPAPAKPALIPDLPPPEVIVVGSGRIACDGVGGALGHLSNQQAAGLLASMDTRRLQQIVIAHISEKNNRPELARQAVSSALDGWSGQLQLAAQNQGLPWQEITETTQPTIACIGSR